ncbi:RNA-directed DNA polymerase, partial [Chryseobacterium sp. 2TAF14]|uniref:RNA-directed DNA polymerase n=1 Tax=Chryseobacterium sp. 2TAF14 TaxID=3233007 RepID=UPI003F933486
MNLTKILEKGYFPKELPPPFTTKSFGQKSRYIAKKWDRYVTHLMIPLPSEASNRQAKFRYKPILNKYSISKLIEFSIAKGQYSRRKLEIPHPQTYFYLCREIVNHWKLIKNVYKLSPYSESKLYSENTSKRSIRTKSISWKRFRNKLTEISFDYKVQLKLDITNFYPTIYTHSIPWSILGKEDSKYYFEIKNADSNNFETLTLTDRKAENYKIADKIDTLVRNCNDKQSIGLPISPDSSFILSEMVSSRIDQELHIELDGIDYKCVRYYDDYYFYTNSIGDAETILKKTQKILYEYKLEVNENKVEIKQLPYFHSDLWNLDIHNYNFKEQYAKDIQEIEYYFSLIFKLVEENRENSSWIISYSLTRFEYGNVHIKLDQIPIFNSLLLKTLYLDTSNIDQIFKIIYNYKIFIDQNELRKIKILLDKLIREHITLNHSFEIAWCLWFYKSFDITCDIEILQSILDSEDQISILIALDIINNHGINRRKLDFTLVN